MRVVRTQPGTDGQRGGMSSGRQLYTYTTIPVVCNDSVVLLLMLSVLLFQCYVIENGFCTSVVSPHFTDKKRQTC